MDGNVLKGKIEVQVSFCLSCVWKHLEVKCSAQKKTMERKFCEFSELRESDKSKV